jgi:hypothetical protein
MRRRGSSTRLVTVFTSGLTSARVEVLSVAWLLLTRLVESTLWSVLVVDVAILFSSVPAATPPAAPPAAPAFALAPADGFARLPDTGAPPLLSLASSVCRLFRESLISGYSPMSREAAVTEVLVVAVLSVICVFIRSAPADDALTDALLLPVTLFAVPVPVAVLSSALSCRSVAWAIAAFLASE